MSDDMIERVARAIHARSDHGSLWSELDVYSKNEYREDARAAIEATGVERLQAEVGQLRTALERIIELMQAMIDEALKENEG